MFLWNWIWNKKKIDDDNHEDENSNRDRDGSKPICILHLKEISLYCKDCEEVLCIDCLVETHNSHSIKKISDVTDIIIQDVEHLCNKNSTRSGIRATKDKIQSLIEISKETKRTLEQNLQIRQRDLKLEVDKEANKLSKKLNDAFQKHESRLQRRIDEIFDCESRIKKLQFETISHADTLQLYCKIKSSLSKEFQTEIIELQQPSLCLNTDMNFSIGIVSPDPDDAKMSQVAKVENIRDSEAYPKHISTLIKGESIGEITKLLPIGLKEAWIIAYRQLYFLSNSTLKRFSSVVADDIACIENGDLLFLKDDSMDINQMDAKMNVTLFTSMTPQCPSCMTYLEKSSTLMVLTGNTICLFGLDGIMKQHLNLPFYINGQVLEGHCSTEYSIVPRMPPLKQNAANYIWNCSRERFYGIFGSCPSSSFTCKGIGYDNQGCLIVSDWRYNTIYRLDKRLKLQKILLDKKAGLVQPTALALKNGLLWLADNERISIYRYSDIA